MSDLSQASANEVEAEIQPFPPYGSWRNRVPLAPNVRDVDMEKLSPLRCAGGGAAAEPPLPGAWLYCGDGDARCVPGRPDWLPPGCAP